MTARFQTESDFLACMQTVNARHCQREQQLIAQLAVAERRNQWVSFISADFVFLYYLRPCNKESRLGRGARSERTQLPHITVIHVIAIAGNHLLQHLSFSDTANLSRAVSP